MAALTQPNLLLPSTTTPTTHHTLSTALTASSSVSHLKQAHAKILRSGLDRFTSLLFKLILSCCSPSSSSLDYALSIFNQIPKPETHLCNRLLRDLSRSLEPEKTFLVYQRMRRDGLIVDRFSLPPLLKAASRTSSLNEGMEIHGLSLKFGFDTDTFVQTGLVGLYGACGRIMDARLVFDRMRHRDVVTWNIMIDGYCQNGLLDEVPRVFEEMKQSDVEPDEMIFSTIISACGRAGNLDYGKVIFELITEKNIVLDPHLLSALITMFASCDSMDLAKNLFDKISPKNVVVSTAMVAGYSKLGRIEAARSVFDKIVEKDLVCWSAMIAGYAESDWPQEALNLFNEMQALGVKPDQVTMLSVISACAHLGVLHQADWVNTYADTNGFRGALPVDNALLDMYAKCGALAKARRVFDKMPRRNVISWTSMIHAFAVHGDAGNALTYFHQMKDENIEPNWVTFVAVLYACSHAGLVEEGRKIFASMVTEYNITPKQEHYGCMVDLLGRAKLVNEALQVIESMPLAPNVIVWGALMAACRIHGEIELGEFAAKQLLELQPDHDGAHVFLSNIYSKAKRWEDLNEIKKLMKNGGVSKEKGWSRIQLNNETHEFLVADRKHKQSDEIYKKLDEVVHELKVVGYAPDTTDVCIDLEEEEKKGLVCWHSEKLALCYGLINDKNHCCIRIIKNLRVCEDCHTFLKLASKVYQREIVVRDRTRFHHYRDGVCSCNDYW
ncbi:hypothetical protein Nepgr_006941 [Nepenthes gracilis]|uniref:DYW domain-containing protein n=1 Tax=Nepenthes gracilis TaxID=150966 RepID=A0AAD3XI24_NEPGR|nr:hypothetical protein Nepgr_006941 [Nepenthes gracilis]